MTIYMGNFEECVKRYLMKLSIDERAELIRNATYPPGTGQEKQKKRSGIIVIPKFKTFLIP